MSKFGPKDVARHVQSGRIIQFVLTPSNGLSWTPTGEPAYCYRLLFEDDKVPGNDVVNKTYVSPASIIEDGRFELVPTEELGKLLVNHTPRGQG